jgi:predicted DNA-binding transcriptional regulator AlpA
MPVTTFTDEEIQSFVQEIKNQLLPALLHELHEKQLPPLLTRKQFMELTDISASKCNELFNRADFPVTRELGHPRVVTKDFFDWLSNTTNMAEINPYRDVI